MRERRKPVTVSDWPGGIAKAVTIRQCLQKADTGCLWSYPFPRVAATQEAIDAVSAKLRTGLDPQYRSFLSHADGWPKFYQDVDLFGTSELLSGPVHDVAQENLEMLDDFGSLKQISVRRDDLLPIAASEEQADVFALCGGESEKPGHVLWLTGELVKDFPSFEEYYSSMLNRLLEELHGFERDAEHKH